MVVDGDGHPVAAPVDESFRDWLGRHIDDPRIVDAIVGLLFIVTYDHDPGRLSAAFANERLRRRGPIIRYVVGGWATLIDQLAKHAIELGVDLRPRTRVRELPEGPTVLAMSLSDARRLTGDTTLEWPGTRTALMDVGLGPRAAVDWLRIYDVDRRIYVGRFSAVDPSLAPPGHHLLQAAAALAPGERLDAAVARTEDLLDTAAPGWSRDVRWRRVYELADQTGAVDLPGTSWHDRPAVHRTGTLAVASDQSAAPGLLAEVAHNAARAAVDTLVTHLSLRGGGR